MIFDILIKISSGGHPESFPNIYFLFYSFNSLDFKYMLASVVFGDNLWLWSTICFIKLFRERERGGERVIMSLYLDFVVAF